jgi:hypothetical protein
MNKDFEAHRVSKGDADYVYDKAVEFEVRHTAGSSMVG